FDYCILSTGRNRQSYIMPSVATKGEYLEVMNSYVQRFEAANKIVIVGGGAVGIDIAAELKYAYQKKSVTLIHSRSMLPPEKVSHKFKEQVLNALNILGVNVILESKVTEEKNGAVITANGSSFESNCTVWCASRGKCCTEFLDELIFESAKESSDGGLRIANDMSVSGFPHIFAIGDVNNFPVIETGGGAIFQANVAVQNLIRLISISENGYDSEVPEPVVLETWGPHMAIILGKKMAVAESMQTGLTQKQPQCSVMTCLPRRPGMHWAFLDQVLAAQFEQKRKDMVINDCKLSLLDTVISNNLLQRKQSNQTGCQAKV
ncbi:hypothetical protein V1512DRAFT_206329, partial [Lipomyces arxii]|uniref:uncharacterized protein n=1 Tax=Lipomyces arxii TaxID=56418 RepID=UPI0034CF260E